MGILDGIGLVVLILLTVAFCSYCYRCCCVSNPTETGARPKRNRRQKNARRKRRRRQRNRTPNANNPPRPPNTPTSQCIVDLYPDEPPQQVMLHPPYPNEQTFQGNPYYPYHQYPVNLVSEHQSLHGQLLPPPYESYQSPQGQCQNFGASMEPDLNCFSQVPPPPPYDTQLRPQPEHTNSQSEDSNRKC